MTLCLQESQSIVQFWMNRSHVAVQLATNPLLVTQNRANVNRDTDGVVWNVDEDTAIAAEQARIDRVEVPPSLLLSSFFTLVVLRMPKMEKTPLRVCLFPPLSFSTPLQTHVTAAIDRPCTGNRAIPPRAARAHADRLGRCAACHVVRAVVHTPLIIWNGTGGTRGTVDTDECRPMEHFLPEDRDIARTLPPEVHRCATIELVYQYAAATGASRVCV